MKNLLKIAFSALLISLSVASLTLYLSQQPRKFRIHISSMGSRSSEDEYVIAILNCSLPEVPKEMPILEVVRHNYTEAEAIAIAREIFNIRGELNITRDLACGTKSLMITNGTQSLHLYDDGALYYIAGSLKYKYGVKLPEFSQAKEIADEFVDQFIQKAKSCDLITSFPLMQIKFLSVDFSEWYGTPPQPTEPMCIRASYTVMYNGVPLIFKGGMYVEIGEGGKILSFRCYWSDVEFGKPVPILVSSEQAIENMGAYARVETLAHEIKSLYINSVELGYFTPAPPFRGNEFLPEYEIKFFVTLKDGSGYDWGTYVPATST